MRKCSSLSLIILFLILNLPNLTFSQVTTKHDSLFQKTIIQIIDSYNVRDTDGTLKQAQELVKLLQNMKSVSYYPQITIHPIYISAVDDVPSFRRRWYDQNTGTFYRKMIGTSGMTKTGIGFFPQATMSVSMTWSSKIKK